jgi:hypothetical protein
MRRLTLSHTVQAPVCWSANARTDDARAILAYRLGRLFLPGPPGDVG